MKLNKKSGFTLIELLVVITIIAILATVWINQFGKSLQKARDSKRTSDILALETAVTQAFTDEQEYPKTDATGFSGSISPYIDQLPKDVKHLQPANKDQDTTNAPALGYVYISWPDDGGIQRATYEISTAFEASTNAKKIANNDNGNDKNRKEIWNVKKGMDTSLKVSATCTANNSTDWSAIIIGDAYLCAATNY